MMIKMVRMVKQKKMKQQHVVVVVGVEVIPDRANRWTQVVMMKYDCVMSAVMSMVSPPPTLVTASHSYVSTIPS